MMETATMAHRLDFVLEGWEGYGRSLVEAVRPLAPEQLAFRGSPEMRSVGDLVLHIAYGRVDWFGRMGYPGCAEIAEEMGPLTAEGMTAEELVGWLERTWERVDALLKGWTVEDLTERYPQPYAGKVFAVSRQWVVFRILAHDLHHGGQLSELLALQGVFPPELTLLGGHLTEPPLWT